ncbi:MAG: LytR C-terminal domain-containing protein [Elusimicrobia bacterium]|nr:LytR C-terminal domain-containing protein [Elusimicrobiota bacterium]
MIAHLYSSVSLRVSRNSNIGFAIISEKPCFVIYHSLSRIVNVINIPEQLLNLKGTDYQKTVAIYRFVSKNLIIPYNSLLYVSIKDKFLTENKFLEVFNFEGSNVKQTIKAFKYIWKLKRTDATNFSWNDAIVSYLEIIGLNPSNFIITQFAGNLNIDKLNLHMSDYNPFLTAEDAIIKVEILNASGVKSRAAKITKYLREKGVDVVNFGNFPSIRKKSKIVNCSDSVRSAFKVRDILDLRKLEIYSRYDSSNMADAIVIIGADFNEDNIPELKR